MSLKPQQVIINGKYQLLEVIGQGSFARVWKAQEFDPQGDPLRLVAIKELNREALSAEALQEQELRFQREIRVSVLLAEKEAPNVVRGITTEQVALEDGSQMPVLVLEYMPAGSLANLLKQHPCGLPVEQAVRYTLDLCAALEALHKLDIVHRDIKPSNILFRSLDGPARLSDFGTAQMPGETVGGSRTLGTAGLQPGTPDYWPPEQDWERGTLHSSADIYALGGVLFEMLTGRCYNRLVKQDPRYPRGTRVSRLRRDTPVWLDRAVAWALQDDPSQRCPSAVALREALQKGLASPLPAVWRVAAGLWWGRCW